MPIILQSRGLPVLAPRTSRFAKAAAVRHGHERQADADNTTCAGDAPSTVPSSFQSAIFPLTLAAAALPRTGTSHNGSNNEPQDFYASQELEAHFLNDSGPTASRISTVHVAPARRREPSTIGLYGVISHSGGGFMTFKPLE